MLSLGETMDLHLILYDQARIATGACGLQASVAWWSLHLGSIGTN